MASFQFECDFFVFPFFGNALIGAFGKNQDGSVNYNDLLWSWHIWVCPDIDTDKDGYIGEIELAAID